MQGLLSLPVVLALAGPAPSTQEAFPPATPESQGLESSALEELAAEVRSYVERDQIVGGELLVLKNRKTVLHEVFGLADEETGEPWTKGLVCNIRSMTKTLTGASIQILADRGELNLEDPVAEYLEGFQNERSDSITISQVLSHRAGLPLTILQSIDEYASLIEMGNAVGERGPERSPGSRFWYSDSGTDALGAVVEVVSGQRLDEFVRTELLEPLGMKDSFYFLDDDDPRRSRIVSLHIGGPGQWKRYLDPDDGSFYPFAWGSQSLYSTPHDYARFLAMWLDGGKVGGEGGERVVLSEEAVRRTLTPVCEMSMLGSEARFPTSFRGLEVFYGQMAVLHVPVGSGGVEPARIVGHSGSDGTIAWAWPDRDLMVLFFTQSRGGGAALRLEETIDRLLVSPELYAADAEVPEDLAPYLGTYVADWANHMREDFVVHAKAGELALDIPSQMDFALVPAEVEGRWTFAISSDLQVWFERDDEGVVNCLRIQQAGMVFEAPRKGTPHDAALREANRADPEALAHLLGDYDDPDLEEPARVFVDGDYLAVSDGEHVFHLWPVPGSDVWVVREAPVMNLSFQVEDGRAVSFTRSAPGGVKTVFPRLP